MIGYQNMIWFVFFIIVFILCFILNLALMTYNEFKLQDQIVKSINENKIKLLICSLIAVLIAISVFFVRKNIEKLRIEELERQEKERLARIEWEKKEKIVRHEMINQLQLIFIQGGSFMMGKSWGDNDEQPEHHVEVNDFYMSKTEVTVEQYQKCFELGICSKPNEGKGCNWLNQNKEKHPINCVNWQQARVFAKWVGGDLPSEAQWEYAARSRGQEIEYPWGNEQASCKYAVMEDPEDGCGKYSTWHVCSKIMGNSKQGLCDMAGNVWEWTLDNRHKDYKGAPTNDKAWCDLDDCQDMKSNETNQQIETDLSSQRIHRGGGWRSYSDMRARNRPYYSASSSDYDFIGIRVVRKQLEKHKVITD